MRVDERAVPPREKGARGANHGARVALALAVAARAQALAQHSAEVRGARQLRLEPPAFGGLEGVLVSEDALPLHELEAEDEWHGLRSGRGPHARHRALVLARLRLVAHLVFAGMRAARAGRRQCLGFLNQRLVEGHDPLVPLRAIVAVVERLALSRAAGRHSAEAASQ